MELRIDHNKRLLENDHFPDWSVNFNPPLSLMNTARSVESTVGFRYEQSKTNIRMLIDLLSEESSHLSTQIAATMASLECHYAQPAARDYKIDDALTALNVLRERDREQEEQDLERRFTAIHAAPLAALWKNLPPGTSLPPGAVRNNVTPRTIQRQNWQQVPQAQPQNFQGSGRGSPRRPAWRGRARGRGTRGTRGNFQPRRINNTNTSQNRRTVQAMMTLLTDMLQN